MEETQIGVSNQALDLLRTAIRIEQDGHAFYMAAAVEAKESTAVRVFLSLARDEMEHLGKLETVYCTLSRTKHWPVIELPPRVQHRVFPRPGQARAIVKPAVRPAHDGDARELGLQHGIQAEQDSIAFYRRAMAKATEPEALAMYEYLLAEEEGHLALLRAEYDHLTQTGFWFTYPEIGVESRD